MAKINTNYRQLQAGYLFPEIARRTSKFQAEKPQADIIRLGIGDTTLPITSSVTSAMKSFIDKLSVKNTYRGYGSEQGSQELREALAQYYRKNYKVMLDSSEIFVSDGAKSDSSNIQSIFSSKSIVAVQDPVYPVYVDSAVIGGLAGNYENNSYSSLVYLTCNEENSFFPDLPQQKVDIIYLCSPNNPTGAVATYEQLKTFVDYALKNKAVIIFDAAYSAFVKDNSLPRSIYEVEGAKSCAIEINSFSKWAGFTGVRLGWTIVPNDLGSENSEQGELNQVWNRRQSTMFNGASNIAQAGGIAVLSKKGQAESQKLVDYYMNNATVIRDGLLSAGYNVYGGENAPYVWLKLPGDINSWEFFDTLLMKTNIVGTPGSGFGKGGEGYFRLSAFGDAERTKEAIERIKEKLPA